MRFLIQRVNQASVTVNHEVIGAVKKGYLILVGISRTDTTEIADKMLRKALNLRIFSDENGKTNRSLADVSGELLLVSQFTLYADCRKGNRPSFFDAGNPQEAEKLYEYLISKAKEAGYTVASGEFGADMEVSLENDGPFTVLLDSEEIF